MTSFQAIPTPRLPDASQREMDFVDTSFFKEPGHHLPTPTEVRALSKDYLTSPEPVPVTFQDLDVFVKFGRHINVAEAQNPWMVKRALGDKVPAPEVFGWRVEGDDVFIYMELVHGKTLKSQWDDLDGLGKEKIRDQLCSIIGFLRQLEPDPAHQFIGVSRNTRHRQTIHLTLNRINQSGVTSRLCLRNKTKRRSLLDYQRFP